MNQLLNQHLKKLVSLNLLILDDCILIVQKEINFQIRAEYKCF